MRHSKAKTKPRKKEERRPFLDFFESLYWLTEKPEDPGNDEELEEVFYEAVKNGAKFGFPVGGIKQAANSAAYVAPGKERARYKPGIVAFANPDDAKVILRNALCDAMALKRKVEKFERIAELMSNVETEIRTEIESL